jgi:hypothetical protein
VSCLPFGDSWAEGAEMKQEFEKEGIWYLGEGDSVLFLELEFLHFFNLENMILTHTKDFCEEKWP